MMEKMIVTFLVILGGGGFITFVFWFKSFLDSKTPKSSGFGERGRV